MFFVFDIDGTLSDLTHRLPLLDLEDVSKWDAFFAACPDDTPVPAVIELALSLQRDGHTLAFWTGRPESVRQKTQEWLTRQGLASRWPLRMRATGDHRHDTEVKLEYVDWSAPPAMIFEDRASVVEAFREAGLRVAQVAKGDF